jgi:glycosyltransferase involved in cell wall biosynthesis
MPASALTPAIRDEIERLGRADIMVGIPSFRNAATIGHVVRAAQAGMVQYFPDLRPLLVNADAGSPDGTQRVVVETEPPGYVEQILLVHPRNRLARLSLTYPNVDGTMGKGAALRTIFEMAAELQAQAIVVVDSDLRSIVPEWIELLAGPILKGGYDFVAPLYARYKYDGTITNNISYPLTRALYGTRIRQPIGGDFAISGDLVNRYLQLTTFDDATARFGIDIWMTHSAINEGFAVCQARLGAKIHDAKDPASDLGPMFRQVVGTLFTLAGVYADRWLRVKGSHPIPEYGFERVIAPEPISVNHAKLVDAFGSARPTHDELWDDFLAPEQLERVMGLEVPDDPARFHFPSELWIRCLYDALVAYHRPGVDSERLLAALTPLYFGRTAGFISETLDLGNDLAERAIEAQALEFEQLKPYLVTRWSAMLAARSASGATA